MLQVLKKLVPHLAAVLLLLVISGIAFYPQIQGDKIVAGDIVNSDAKTKHIKDYMESNEDLIYWNSAQFSGGPIFLLSLGKKNNFLRYIDKAITFNHAAPIGLFFALSLVMYISIASLGVKPIIAFIFSVAAMFTPMYLTLLEAGHFSKVYTLAYLPFIISGLILVLQNKYVKGGILFATGLSLSIYSGHVQMIYYLALGLVFFPIPFIVDYFRKKEFKSLYKVIGVLLIGVLLGVASNFSQLYSSLVFSEKTMRGGDVLEMESTGENKGGLDWDYAMNWSYEVKDFFNVLVPRIVGGASQEMVDKENPLAKLMIQNNAPVKDGKVGVPGYWGNMPFTSGSAYIGGSLLFVFVLALFFSDKRIVISSLIFFFVIFLLSLGSHAGLGEDGLTLNINRFLYDHFPMFDKFRSPSSAVSVLPAFVIIIGALGIEKLTQRDTEKFKQLLYASGIFFALLVTILILGNSSFSFLSLADSKYDYQIQQIFIEGRKMLFTADVYRSMLIVAVSFGLIFLKRKNYLKQDVLFYGLVGVLFCADLVPVTNRFFNQENFVSPSIYEAQFAASTASLQITKTETQGRGYYRVLDLTTNVFNDAKPAYHHNQIGGYDPTKLQRYQDLIDYYISPSIQTISNSLSSIKTMEDVNQLMKQLGVLNMLNCKYIIVNPNSQPLVNAQAMKNAWFVNQVDFVESNQEEIKRLGSVDLRKTAVVNQADFGDDVVAGDGSGSIKLTAYTPNKLTYKSQASSDQLAVFSEVWYGGNPDWVATIDGKEADIIRTNYILRAMEIPAGEHEIVMEFSPVPKGAVVSILTSLLILLLAGFAVYKENQAKLNGETTA